MNNYMNPRAGEYKIFFVSPAIHELARKKAMVQGRSIKAYIERLIILDRSKN